MCTFAPDCLCNLDKDIYCVLAQFLYLWNKDQNIDFTNKATVQISYPSFAKLLAKKSHQAAKITVSKGYTYSAHPYTYYPFPFKSFIPFSHISEPLRWENELMVDITRHSFWNKLTRCEAIHNLIPNATVYMCTLSRVWLWVPMDCSLSGSSIHGTSPARILEWAFVSRILEWAFVSSSRGS